MAIKSSGAFNSPEMAQVAQNIAQMFGPPSAGDLAGYSTARKNNQEVDHKARLAQIALDPNSDWTQLDRAGLGLGGWTPNQSFEGIDRNNATTRYGHDSVAATSRANNIMDNQTKLVDSFMGPANPTFSSMGLTPDLADHFAMPEMPARAGTPAPMSETQWKANQGQRLVDEGLLSNDDIIGLIADGSEGSAREQQISRLAAQLVATNRYVDPEFARNMAVGLIDGRYEQSRDPTTGEVVVIDMTTNQPADMQAAAAAPELKLTGDPVIDAVMAPTPGAPARESVFGEPYPASGDAFGVGGALTGLINTAADAAGAKVPFPEVQNTQASFRVLRERLLSDMESAYGGRQPPSWLMQEIRSLTPDAGNAFEGTGAGAAKLNALGRQMQQQLELTQRQLEGNIGQTRRQELEAEAAALEASIANITQARNSFPGQQAPGPRRTEGPATSEAPQGVDPADWQYMTEEERSLFR